MTSGSSCRAAGRCRRSTQRNVPRQRERGPPTAMSKGLQLPHWRVALNALLVLVFLICVGVLVVRILARVLGG